MDGRTTPGELDFAAMFAALPGATAVLAADPPRFSVLAASDALIAVSQRPRDAVVGRPLDAFPNASPEDPQSSGLTDLWASLAAAVRTGAPQPSGFGTNSATTGHEMPALRDLHVGRAPDSFAVIGSRLVTCRA